MVKSMAHIYIWLPGIPGGTEWFHGHVGHAAIQIGRDYFSYWPGPGKQQAKFIPAAPAFRTQKEDLETKGFEPDNVIEIKNLGEPSMVAFWEALKKQQVRYNFIKHNCCTTVAVSLRVGFLESPRYTDELLTPRSFSWSKLRLAGKLRKFVESTEVSASGELKSSMPISPRILEYWAQTIRDCIG